MIVFSDGVEIATDGRLRVVERCGSYYLVGEGNCLPVANQEAGELLLSSIETQTVFMNMKVFKSPGSRRRASAAVCAALEERESATTDKANHGGGTP